MIATRAPGLWSFVALLIATVAITAWRASPVAPVAPVAEEAPAGVRPVTYRYVPLSGIPLYDAIDEADGDHREPPLEAPAGPVKTCLPFLAPILQYPNWQLRISNGFSTCFGDTVEGDFTIASTGEVTWTTPGGPVRHLALSSEQLALVRRLDQLSCVELQPDHSERGWLSIGLDLGKHYQFDGARISPASTLGRTVTAMLDDLTTRYRQPRREAMGSFDLRLETTERGAVYSARVTGGRLTVKHGRKLLAEEPVDVDQLIDLVDAALERPPIDNPDVKGVLLMNGWSVPVSLWRHEKGPFALIDRAIPLY